jgi:hypothetical protein
MSYLKLAQHWSRVQAQASELRNNRRITWQEDARPADEGEGFYQIDAPGPPLYRGGPSPRPGGMTRAPTCP